MNHRTLLAAVSALALLAAPALAQTTSPGNSGAASPRSLGGPATTAPQPPKPDPLKQEDVSQISGAAVYGSDNKKIGTINTVLMKPESRQIDRLVVGAGGVLGIGAHDVALPIDQFHWDATQGGFTITKTEADLKAMPAWGERGGEKTMSGSSTAPPSAPSTTTTR